MNKSKIKTEYIFYWLAFLLAFGLRFYQLGAAPLSNTEAGWALQALGVSHGETIGLGAQPAYIIITGVLFSIFGDGNLIARFIPALAGSLLVWLPFLFRDWMSDSRWLHRAGLVMAFGLAIDPGLVSLSRHVGSPIPALTFLLLALAFLHNRHMVWVGIFAGLALLSGPAFLQGVLILGISWGLFRLINHRVSTDQPGEGQDKQVEEPVTTKSIGVALFAFIGTVFVTGTLFLRLPQGLGALAATIPAYLQTWIATSGIPLLRLPASLLIYQLLVVLFALIGIGRLWFSPWDDQHTRQVVIGLSIWAVVAFLLPLLYAGKQVSDMAWVLIPLWALAAIEISRSFLFEEDTVTHIAAAGLGLLLFVLAVVGWINLLSIGRFQVSVVVYWAIIIGALLLGFIAVLLVAATWSTLAARLGLVWAMCTVLGLLLFSFTWGMAFLHPNSAQELWVNPSSTGQADQLNATLSDLSSRNTGLRDQLEIVALVDPPSQQWEALKWELRHYPNARFATSLSSVESPPVVITYKGAEVPTLAEKYRGQDFIWWINPGWQGVLPPNFINWLAFRQAPSMQDQIILWARADTFPGGASEASGSAAP
jgi:hypothetical protein